MATFSLSDPLDYLTITNLFLYGSPTTPANIFDRIRSPQGPDTVEIDAQTLMQGPGRYATPNLARFVQSFFADASSGTLNSLPAALKAQVLAASGPVTFTVAQLEAAGVSDAQFRFSFVQRGWDPATNTDYGARTYIYNSQTYYLDDNTQFVYDPTNPANSQLKNVRILPKDEDFDFSSSDTTGAGAGGKILLKPAIDPYDLAQKHPLLMHYINLGNVVPISSYTSSDFKTQQKFKQDHYNLATGVLYTTTAAAMIDILNDLSDKGVIEYAKDGRPIIYGSGADDTLGPTNAAPKVLAFSLPRLDSSKLPPGPVFSKGAIFVSGPGDDAVTGTDKDDVIYGGSGVDTLIGNGGSDYLDGGSGTDKAVFLPLASYRIQSGGAAPSGFKADGSGSFYTVNNGANTTTLHSIEAVSLPRLTVNFGSNAPSNSSGAYQISIVGSSLVLSSKAGDSISLAGTSLASGASPVGADNIALIAVTGDSVAASGGSGNNILVAAGTHDTLNASQSGQKLIALGQSGDVLNGQTTNKSGLDKLIAVAGEYTGGTAPKAGTDTLNAGIGNNIMIGEGVDTTFNINAAANPNAIDVIWGTGVSDAINISGQAQVMVVSAPGATLASVKNLDIQKLYQQVQGFTAGLLAMASYVPIFANEATVIVINATPNEQLTIDGIKASAQGAGYANNFLGTFDNNFTPQTNENFVLFPDGTPNGIQSWIVGLKSGDFGITSNYDPASGEGFINGGTPTVDLAKDQVQSSSNTNGGPGGGPDPRVIDQSGVFVSDVSDTLLSISAATAFAFNDTLVAANGADTLTVSGADDTMFGNGAGSTLVNHGSFGDVAAYAIDNVTVDLGPIGGNQSATINGSSISDTLIGITEAEALGTNDTLIGRNSGSTLIALTAGNTLIGEGGATLFGTGVGSTLISYNGIAWYQSANSVVNLVTGTAKVDGASTSDTLIGVQNAVVAGQNSTILGGDGDTLTAYGSSNTLIAGSGIEVLEGHGTSNTLIGGGGTDYLLSDGFGNTLIAGTGSETLSSTGAGDTLIGNGAGSQLITAFGGIAAYTIDNVVVDLATNLATIQGASVSDTLQNISAADALGNHDTLIGGSSQATLTAAGSQDVLEGGSGGTTFTSNLNGNTLIAGTGLATANYSVNNATINLGAGTAFVNGSSTSDTLIGISQATVSGSHDTLIGGSVADVLVTIADDNTLIAGSGTETLTSKYSMGNTLIAGSGADTLSAGGGMNNVLLAGNGAAETLSSSGFNNTLVAGSGSDMLSTSGTSDTLLGGTGASILSASGSNDSLIAGSGSTTLIATGVGDTLFGNGAGNTLNGTAGTGAIAAYTSNNITINLATGTAGVHGAGTVDTLLGFRIAAALGSNETIIDGNGGSTLFSDAAGNTLIGGTGETVAAYSANNVSVNLSTGTAGVDGSGTSDSLIGIAAAAVSGSSDTIIAGNGADVLSSTGSGNTLIAGSGADTLTTSGTGDTLIGGAGADTLSASGSNAILHGGAGQNVLSSTGSNNTMVAGAGASTLLSSGSGDTLFGNASGSSLSASSGTGATAAYALNNVVVDVAAGTATVNGGSVSDTLTGFSTFAALGSNDTLVDGNSGSTLFSNASGNTLEGGTGETVAAYASSDLTINLATGTAGVNGAAVSDTLIGIHGAYVSGSNDVLLGDSGNDLLSSSGSGNTLIAGSAADTLISTGSGDTLIGNLLGSTLESSSYFSTPIAAYTADNVTVDLSAGTASLNGSGISDRLVGISTAEALGSHDTLSGGGGGGFTFISNGNDNTLTAGQAEVTALYKTDNITVNLVDGSAGVDGSSASDTLIGIMTAIVSGANDTIVSGGTGNSLSAENTSDVAAFAVDNLSVDVAAGTAGVNGSGAEDTISGFQKFVVSGSHDSVTGGQTAGSFEASGSQDTLVAGASDDTLVAGGADDTLVGNLAGATLQATSSSTAAVALYTFDNVAIDLAGGTVSSVDSTLTDTLIGITNVSVTGSFNTLLAGGGSDTLLSTGSFNSLVGGSGADTLTSSGQNDVLIAGSGAQALISRGTSNTLVAGSAADQLTSIGTDDSLVGNGGGSTLDATDGIGAIAAYTIDGVVVDLSAGTAAVNGASTADSLIGIRNVAVSGVGDTIIGSGGTELLAANGLNDTVIAGGGVATLTSSGSQNTLIAGSGNNTLKSSGSGDVLLGGVGADLLSSNGSNNTLVAGGGNNSLSSSGTSDTLIGNGGGSALDGSLGTHTVAAYALDNVVIDLATGTARVNGTGLSDTLTGISSVLALGTGDTLIGGAGATTLYSNAAGNTLVAGAGLTTAVYAADDANVNLSLGSATVKGAQTEDALIGITNALVSGMHDTLTGGTVASTLSSNGSFNTIIAGNGADVLSSTGLDDTLVGGSGVDTLSSSGLYNTLVSGSGANLLISGGTGDILIGNAAGSTLDGTNGSNVFADYALDNVVVDLTAGTAAINGSSVSDTLLGIAMAMASGQNDTLIGGAAPTTLSSNGNGNTLIAGAGETTALYALNDFTVDISASSATVNGSGIADTLVGITLAVVAGANDTLIGGGGADTLISAGQANTVLAGSGVDTLVSIGVDDTLVGNGLGSTLDGSNASGVVAAYSLNNATIDLGSGSATVNGSGVSDTLVGIVSALALGSGDTLIGGSGATTLGSNAAGNTLIAGSGQTTASYGIDNVVVNLATGTASIGGSSASDTLIGLSAVSVSGSSALVIANDAGDLVIASGDSDTVFGGGSSDTLLAQGASETLAAGGGAATLSSSGNGNILVAGSGADLLMSSGVDDTLYGNAAGSTLDGTTGIDVVAAYTADNVTIDLATGTARIGGSSVFDRLVSIDEAAALGTHETLIAGLGDETLFGGGGANAYVFAAADGDDVVKDAGNSSQAIFSDIASTGVTFSVSPLNSDDLLITINGTGKTVTVEGQFGASGRGELQDFTFADGVTLTAAQVATMAGAGSGAPPTVDVSIDRSLLNLANSTATVTFAFSAAPAAFTLADTSVVGGTLSNLAGSGTAYTATFTAAAGIDISNASVSVNANSWQSGGTNGAGGSTPSFAVDTVRPTVAISVDHSALNVAGPTALVTFTFSDAPTSFTLADTNVAGGLLSNLSGSGTTYTATFTAASNTQMANASVAVNAGSWQNVDGNAGAGGTSSTFNVDTVAPAVSSIAASPSSGDENTGNVIHLTLTMSKSVSVTGTPALALNDGGTALYQSGSGTSTLVFAYTVANGQNTSALAVIGNNLNGSSVAIMDADGNAADLAGADASFPGLMVGATVVSVTATPSSGDLGPGKVVTFTVNTTEPVTITGGTPTLSLNDGGVATYKSGSGTHTLNFAYTIGATGSGQNTAALAVTGFNANGATVYDSGVAADTADLSGVASFVNGPQVDTTAPAVSSVTAAPSSGDLDAGNSITITVNLTESVAVTGSPYLALNDGGKATYVSGSGSNALTFTYTVAAGQNTSALAVSSMSTNGGTIKDAAGNSAVLSGAASNLGGALQIDTKAPAVTEHLTSDTGVSKTDLITSNDSLTGGGDANAVVHFTVDGSAIATTTTASSTGAWTFAPTGLADGSHTIVASETDAAGNTGSATLTFTQDTTPPMATSIAANPANADFDAGNTVTLTVQFNDTVYATSTSYLLLNDGGKALYSSGTGTNALTFTYTVTAGQNTANLAVTAFSAGLTDVVGNAALLAGTTTNPGGTIQIDTTAPKITSITTSGTGIVAGKGDLGPGQTVTLTVNFGEAVLVNTAGGTPTLALSNGGVATYVSGSGSSALTFAYTVGALGGGQDSADLKLASTSAVSLNGAAITDLAGNAAVLTAANNYNPAGVLQIDTTAPTITTVVSSPATGDVTTGHVVKITLTPSEAVAVSGTPELLLNDGGMATYDAAHSTSKALVFNYTAAAGDSTPNLAISGIELPTGSSINDLAGNNAALAGAAKSLGVQINTTATGSSGTETGNVTLSGSSNAELFGASLAHVSFDSGSTGTLRLDASSQFTGTVAGLALGNYVDLADLAYQGNNAPVYSSTGTNTGSVAVTEGTTTINVALLGSYMANSFVASSDGHGGTLITDPPPPPQVVLGPSLHA